MEFCFTFFFQKVGIQQFFNLLNLIKFFGDFSSGTEISHKYNFTQSIISIVNAMQVLAAIQRKCFMTKW